MYRMIEAYMGSNYRLAGISALLSASFLLVPFAFAAPGSSAAKTPSTTPSSTQNVGTGLAFSTNGTVSGVYVYPGKKVLRGQILVALDASALVIQLQEAQDSIDYQKIKLDQLLQSTSSTSTDAIHLQNNQDAIKNARENAISLLQDGYVKAEDAVRNRVSQIFSNVQSGTPQILLTNSNQVLAAQVANQYSASDALLTTWKTTLDSITSGTDLNAVTDLQIANIKQMKNFLDMVAQFMNFTSPDQTTSQVGLKNIRTDIASGRANVLLGLGEAISARSRMNDAQAAFTTQQVVLSNNLAYAIPLQAAVLRQAQDKQSEIQYQIDHMTIRAPESGTVTRVTVALGSPVNARIPVVYVRPARAASSRVSFLGDVFSQTASVVSAFESLWRR